MGVALCRIAVLLALTMPLTIVAQITESIEVRITNVEVVATDSAGKPAYDLTRDDFSLFEDGQPQPITNFYEVRSSAVATEPDTAPAESLSGDSPSVVQSEQRQRKIIVFIDNVTLGPHRRKEVLTAVRTSLESILRPGDDVMVAVWERQLKILQPFTADRSVVLASLQKASTARAGSPTRLMDRDGVIRRAYDLLSVARSTSRRGGMTLNEAYQDALFGARMYAESETNNTRAMLNGLRQMISTLSGLEGRKALLFVGGELQQNPGVDLFETVNGIYRGAGVNVTESRMVDTDRALREELDMVIRSAAGGNVPLYMVDTGDRAAEGDATTGGPVNAIAGFMAESETWLTMGQLAESTGGRALAGTRNYRAVLDGMASDLGSYYSLGYRATASQGLKRIEVRSRRPGVRVRSRKIVHHKSAHEQMADRVVSNAFHSTLKSDFPVTVTAGAPQRDGRNYRIPVTISFPSNLVFIPQDGAMVGEFAVYIVVAGADGSLSPVSSTIRPVKFPAAALTTVVKKPFEYTTTVMVRPGQQMFSVAIVDRVGDRVGYASARIAPGGRPRA